MAKVSFICGDRLAYLLKYKVSEITYLSDLMINKVLVKCR